MTCETCAGARYVRVDLPREHPFFGRLYPCPECNPWVASEPDEYGLLPGDRMLGWSNVIESIDPSITAAKAEIQRVITRGFGWVYLWGGYGTAKTHLLKIAVAEYLRSQAGQAVYLRMVGMMDDIRSAFDDKNPSGAMQAKLRWYAHLPLLAIDEIEKVNSTDFVEERRFLILDTRYEAATRLDYGVTLIAGNVPPEKLPGAITSRIRDERFSTIHITAADMRAISKVFERSK